MQSVLKALLDVFPQIDLRILKAVADEFPRDADAAAEFILSDVLPIITSQPVETSHAPAALGQDQPFNVANEAGEGGLSAPIEDVAAAEISENQEQTQSVMILPLPPDGDQTSSLKLG